MRIERVDDKTVKCFLSNEDLEQYQIDYKDFIMRSEKAKEVVQEIIEQAEEEVGYKPPEFVFDVQIMMLPEEGLLLVFSEKEPDGQIMECLKEMKKVLQQAKENIGLSGEKSAKKEPVKQPDFAVFAFSKLRNVMEYAATLPANLRVDSELYELDDIYYLFLRRGHASYSRYSKACIQAMEFAGLYTAEERHTDHLKEHGICLIAEKALKKLRGSLK